MRIIFIFFLLLLAFCGFSQGGEVTLVKGVIGVKEVKESGGGTVKIVKGVNLVNGLTGRTRCLNIVANNDTTKKAPIRIRCVSSTRAGQDPLLVIDGVVVELGKLNSINPNDIENVHLLKSAAATAIYGCRASAGVILITTKQSKLKQFVVKDFLDGKAVEGSTVTFTFKKDTLMFAADKNGSIETDRLKAGIEYAVSVTSTGYKPLATTVTIKNKTTEFLLQREFVTNKEVVVVGYPPIRCGRLCCSVQKTIACGPDDSKVVSVETTDAAARTGFNFYPNPLQRGQSFTIEHQSLNDDQLSINIISMDGRKVAVYPWKVRKGPNRTMITTHAGLAAGTYIVQLMDNTSSKAAAGKLLIR